MIKLATVFSGIGAIEQALHKMKIDYKVVFACDNGERELKKSFEDIEKETAGLNQEEKTMYIKSLYDATGKPNFVKKSYFANYKIEEDNWYEDIRFIDGNQYAGQVDLFVGGSPCQSFSISGKRFGLEDTRGTLFYDFARLVKQIQPKVFIYENVPGMLSHDGGKTWSIISEVFSSLHYNWELYQLNAKDYGIPQNRRRIYVVGVREDLDINPYFEIPKIILDKEVKDFLEPFVGDEYYHGEKGFKWITKPKSLEKRVSINSKIARTQAANQQFNWCGDMIFEKLADRKFDESVYVGEFKGEKGVARKLTPRECLRLMGFSDDFKIVVDDNKMYRQSGNSIVVNVLESIMKEVIRTEVFEEKLFVEKLKVGTVFSGIGSFEWALKRLGIEHEIVFACDNGDVLIDGVDYEKVISDCRNAETVEEMHSIEREVYAKARKTNYVEQSYMANFDINPLNFHYDVKLLDGTKYKDKVDIFVGGSPCQSFSMMGYQKGLEDARGTLFYEYARLVKEIQPKVFIYENVQGLLKHDHGNTWEVIKSIFDSLGYYYSLEVLNSKDYSIPQNRNRLFVVGFKKEVYLNKFKFPAKKELKFKLQDFLTESCDEGYFSYDNYEKHPGEVDVKHFLSEKVKAHVMAVGTKNYVTIPKTDLEIARPLLATMHKMHRAGVDNYVTVNGKLRRLTPRECLRLMGFGDDFKQVVSDTQMYKQAGNSIVSDIFVNLIPCIINTGVFGNE